MNATIDETTTRCPLCGEPLPENAENCTKCDWVRGYRHQEGARHFHASRDIAAAVISVVPGAGHFLKGYPVHGALILLLGVPVVCVLGFAFTMFFGFLLVPAYWVAVAADAYLRKDLKAPQSPGPTATV